MANEKRNAQRNKRERKQQNFDRDNRAPTLMMGEVPAP